MVFPLSMYVFCIPEDTLLSYTKPGVIASACFRPELTPAFHLLTEVLQAFGANTVRLDPVRPGFFDFLDDMAFRVGDELIDLSVNFMSAYRAFIRHHPILYFFND